jgi:hypothetical protein
MTYSYDDQYNVVLKSTTKNSSSTNRIITDFSAIDYFQFDFSEIELHNCWKLVHNSRVNRCFIPHSTDVARLENMSWRKWTKLKYNLGEISPDTVDWYKECDITWLYGPLVKVRHGEENFGFDKSVDLSSTESASYTSVQRHDSISSISSTSTMDSSPFYSDSSDEEDEEYTITKESVKPILKQCYSHGPFGLEAVRRSSTGLHKDNKFKKSVSFADMVDIRQF